MTTGILRDLVQDYFSGQEWSLTFEVGNGTGHTVNRHADAVAMNLWPSRGLAIHGIEIKASRGDWQKELANPAKAEEIHRHCDFWWLVTANGVVKDIGEIPPGWGFMEMMKRDDDKPPRLKLKRQAARMDRDARVDRGFVAAILRAHQRSDSVDHQRRIDETVARIVESRVESALASRSREKSEAVERLKIFTTARADIGDLRWLDDAEICRAVALVLKSGLVSSFGGLMSVVEGLDRSAVNAKHAADKLREIAAETGISLREDMAVLSRRVAL